MDNQLIFKLDTAERKILDTISDCGQQLNYPVFAIGGFVRDRLIGRPSKDIDIVCLGDGIKLAQEVASKFRPIPNINILLG